jgi:hypothetical protein
MRSLREPATSSLHPAITGNVVSFVFIFLSAETEAGSAAPQVHRPDPGYAEPIGAITGRPVVETLIHMPALGMMYRIS